jgi:hypothetical protein
MADLNVEIFHSLAFARRAVELLERAVIEATS